MLPSTPHLMVPAQRAAAAAGGGGGSTVVFDASGYDNAGGASPKTSTLITVGGGSNRALAVYIGQRTGSLTGVSSVTWNGTSMSLIGTDANGGTIWGLVNPASGNNNLVVTFTGGGTVTVAALSVTSALQTGGSATFSNYTTNSNTNVLATVTCSSANGQIGFAGWIEATNNFSTVNTGSNIGSGGSTNGQASCYNTSTGATVTMSYNLLGSDFWSGAGISIVGA